MKVHWLGQAAVGAAALTVLQAALSFLAPAVPARPPALGGVVASNVLTAAVLAWISARLRGHAAVRVGVLWLLSGGVQALALVEVLLFDVRIPEGDVRWLAAHALAVSAGLAAVLGLGFRNPRHEAAGDARPRRWPDWWRWAACGAAYVLLYFSAGALVWPHVRAFYEAAPMPGVAAVAATQVFRGLALTAIVLALVRRLDVSRTGAAVASGLALSILGGVAPLLVENPYLPDALRYAHMPEVGVSNLVFGLLAGWLLADARPRGERAPAAAVNPARPAPRLG